MVDSKYTFGVFLLLIIIACKESINPEEILKSENNFELTTTLNGHSSLDSSVSNQLAMNSKVISGLKGWMINNDMGWNKSVASFSTPPTSITSNDFRFLIYKDFVVMAFTDKDGRQQQYTKRVKKSELDFLTE